MNTEQIEILLIDLLRSEGNLIINKSLIKKVGLIPAILLSNYLEKCKYFKENYPENDGWFFLSHKKIMGQLEIKEYSITQAKKTLVDLELIEIERRGIPSKEWIYINFDNFYELMTNENYKGQVPEKTAVLVPTKTSGLQQTFSMGLNNKTNKNSKTNKIKETNKRKRIYVATKKVATDTPKNKNTEYLPIALELKDIVQSQKNIKVNGQKTNSWANSIRLLVETDDVSLERVESALSWYKDHHSDDYVPVIESGSSLREKFLRLEAAIERDKKPFKQNKQKAGYTDSEPLKYKTARKV